jgi:small subunit ribosomal protein S6
MKQNRTHLYEGMYIISAQLSDDARQKTLDKIQTGITEGGGEVLKTHDWGRRRLAYEINGHREGHYYIMYFSLPTEQVAELHEDYKLNEDLVRFVTFRTEEVAEKIEFKSLAEQ